MDAFGLILGAITTPLAWPIALLILVAVMLLKGFLIPRSQSDALIAQHEKVEEGLRDTIKLIREDRDSALAAMTAERDIWRQTTQEAQAVAQQVRNQNDQLIERLEVFDYAMNSMRIGSGVKGGESDEQ